MKDLKKISITILALSIFACSNDDATTEENPGENPTIDVYVAGYVFDGKETAVYWKNGVITKLTDDFGSISYAKAISVVGNDVYVAGEQKSSQGEFRAVVWKNGVVTPLNTPTVGSASVTCMVINNNDIYVGGLLERNGSLIAVYWKNNEPIVELTDGSTDASVLDIAFANNIVHAVGYRNFGGTSTAMYWRNGFESQVTTVSGVTSYGYSIFIANNNDTYIVLGEIMGQGKRVAKYRKNTEIFSLSDGSRDEIAKSITVIGNDVYLGGNHYDSATGKNAIKYWKNNQPTILYETSDGAASRGMAVLDDKVYIVGFLEVAGKRLPTIWNNTQNTNLSTLPGEAGDIFIVKN